MSILEGTNLSEVNVVDETEQLLVASRRERATVLPLQLLVETVVQEASAREPERQRPRQMKQSCTCRCITTRRTCSPAAAETRPQRLLPSRRCARALRQSTSFRNHSHRPTSPGSHCPTADPARTAVATTQQKQSFAVQHSNKSLSEWGWANLSVDSAHERVRRNSNVRRATVLRHVVLPLDKLKTLVVHEIIKDLTKRNHSVDRIHMHLEE